MSKAHGAHLVNLGGMPGTPQEKGLSGLQAWFAEAIGRRLPKAYACNPLAASAPDLEAEANGILRGKGGMAGFARLGVYNQQYWFRLVSIMQSEYPCALRLLGLHPFNEWVVHYLEAHPPASPFLAELDLAFPAFMEDAYREGDRESVLQAVAYDRALSNAVDAPDGVSLASVGPGMAADPMTASFALAPHLTPLRIGFDFAEFRALCLGDESLEERFVLRPGPACLAVFRDRDLGIRTREVSPAAFAVLLEFRRPATLAAAFGRLENILSPADLAALESALAGWFREWTSLGWLCLAGGPTQAGPAKRSVRRSKSSR